MAGSASGAGGMRLSLLISILVHVIILWALLTLFNVVPQMKVPKTVYNVKILRPFVAPKVEEPKEEPKAEVEVKKPEVTTPKPKPKEKKKEPEKKPQEKPAETKQEDKPMDVSMQEGNQTEVAVDAPQFPFAYYLSAIERKVSENWLSVQGGREGGISCMVYFRLSRNGRVSDLRVETPSGNSYFDRSALKAIKSAEPYPPLPRAFGESWLGIHFTFTQKK
jgi:TonB family protein